MSRCLCLLLVGLTLPAAAYEPARREYLDAGVHVPVLTRAPELLDFVQADYPPEPYARSQSAAVKLTVTIAVDGTVSDAQVTVAAGDGFDEAALAAVKRFRFSPAEVDGAPAPVQIEYVYNFAVSVADAGVPEPDDAGVTDVPIGPRATLKGQLLVRGNRARISGGTVRCDNQPDAGDSVSDDEGRFSLQVAPGQCKVVVAVNGFFPYETDEDDLEANETREVNYFILERSVGYQTVVKARREKKEVVRRTLDRAEIQKIPGTFGDPIRVVQNFPGVARAPFLSGQLIVRGANPSQTLTFLDGVEIPILFHLGGGPSVINAEFIDKIDFYPGGFGARYGRAVGGIVDVGTRRGAADTFHGVVQVDFLGASIFLEAPITPTVSLAGAVRRSYIDALLPAVISAANTNPDNGTLLILPVYWDYQLRLDVGAKRSQKLTDGASNFSLMAFGSDDQLKVSATGAAAGTDITIDFHTLFHRLVGNWLYRAADTSFRLTPWVGYDLGQASLGIIKFKVDQFAAGLRADLAVDVKPWLTLRGGTDIYTELLYGVAELPILSGVQYVEFPGEDPVQQVQRIARAPFTFDGALYAEGDIKVGPVTITPGLRASTANIYGQTRHAFDPRLWVRWELFGGSTQIKGSVGLYTQPPSAIAMEQPPFGNPALTHEKAFQSSLGVFQKITENLNVDVTGFYNRRYENVAQPGPTVVNADGSVTTLQSANTGLGRAYGVEVLLRHEVTKNFFGWLAYTLSRAEESQEGKSVYTLTQYDQTHILTVIGSYRFDTFCSKAAACGGWEIGGRFRYVTGNPSTPLIHDYDLYRNDENSYSATRGTFRSSRLRSFNQLDVRIDKSFPFDRWTLGVYLDIQNIYNAKNQEAQTTDYRRRQEYDVQGIPFLPILGIKGSL